MSLRLYLQKLINAIAKDFEYWAVYESSLTGTLISLFVYQLFEDGVAYLILTLPTFCPRAQKRVST